MRYLRAKKVIGCDRSWSEGTGHAEEKGWHKSANLQQQVCNRLSGSRKPRAVLYGMASREALGVLDKLERLLAAAMTPPTSTVKKWCAQPDSRAANIAS